MDNVADELEVFKFEMCEIMEKKFNNLILELNKNGSEYSRFLNHDFLNFKEKTKTSIDEVYNWIRSKLISIEQGQQLLNNDKDGLINRTLRQAEAAVKLAADSAENTAKASLATAEARECLKKSIEINSANSNKNIVVLIFGFIGFIIPVTFGFINLIITAKASDKNQKDIIAQLEIKIQQDRENQAEMIKHLKKLEGGGRK